MKKKNDTIKEEPVSKLSDDRRNRRRYQVDFSVQYRVMRNGLVKLTGSGVVLNMSSTGIAFATQETLSQGATVELSISWPVLLNGNCRLKLVVQGRVVRSDGYLTAIRLERHEFRTQGKTVQPIAELPDADLKPRYIC